MKDKVFIDSNMLIYGSFGNFEKKQKAKEILTNANEERVISIQVLKEFTNVCLKKKLHNSDKELIENILQFKNNLFVADITYETIIEAIQLKAKTGYSFYDSLLIATALEQGCKTLYSEDLHKGQMIKGKRHAIFQ